MDRISIHASAKEATKVELVDREEEMISIHASAKEATHDVDVTTGDANDFNPRLREGGDRNIL